jgi:hypothetical protein
VVVVVVVVGDVVVVVVGADVVVAVTVVVGPDDVVGDPFPFPPEQADSTSINPVHKAIARTRIGPP